MSCCASPSDRLPLPAHGLAALEQTFVRRTRESFVAEVTSNDCAKEAVTGEMPSPRGCVPS
jgi:hypothetical protein